MGAFYDRLIHEVFPGGDCYKLYLQNCYLVKFIVWQIMRMLFLPINGIWNHFNLSKRKQTDICYLFPLNYL